MTTWFDEHILRLIGCCCLTKPDNQESGRTHFTVITVKIYADIMAEATLIVLDFRAIGIGILGGSDSSD